MRFRRFQIWGHGIPPVVGVLALSLSVQSAEQFLRVPGVSGESQAAYHVGDVDLDGWGWQTSPGTNGVVLDQLSVRKRIDKASPLLMKALCTGSSFSNLVLTTRAPGSNFDYFRLQLEDVGVHSINVSASADSAEVLGLQFRALKLDYVLVKSDGTAGSRAGATWDNATLMGNTYEAKGLEGSLAYQVGQREPTLSWTSLPHRTYRILLASSPAGPYEPVATYESGENYRMSVPMPLRGIQGFFRVEESSAAGIPANAGVR